MDGMDLSAGAARLRIPLLVGLLASSALLLAYPVEPELSTKIIFDDPAWERITSQSVEEPMDKLVLRITHDEGGSLTNIDPSRVQSLLKIESEMLNTSGQGLEWRATEVAIVRLDTPFSSWSDALESRNRSLRDATKWADVLQPSIEGGWCGDAANAEEVAAFEATLLLLPRDGNPGIACPSFAGSDASQPPAANEILWLVEMESTVDGPTDWGTLSEWAERASAATEFQFDAVGVNMLFQKSKQIAEDDLQRILLPSFLLLLGMLVLGLRDPLIAAVTLAAVALVISSGLGILSMFGHTLSVLDAVALPIIMGVAVDGAFWYCRSSRQRDEVRSMLFIAMITTVAAVSLAFLSPIRAQRSLGLVMVLGIVLDWLVTRFLLEEFYLGRRPVQIQPDVSPIPVSSRLSTALWPTALLLLASVALIAPPGVEVLDVEQFLPADDVELDELYDLQSRYVLASSTIAWLAVDVDGDSTEDLQAVLDLQRQIGDHPSVISLDTGVVRRPMVIGLPLDAGAVGSSTIDGLPSRDSASLFQQDARLRRDGVTTGVAIAILLDSQDADAALRFQSDLESLLVEKGLSGELGGELVTGASLARDFDRSRVFQIAGAGVAVLIVSLLVVRSPARAIRIAVGAVAIGIAVDGIASLTGGRGVETAPAVLLGMGFAADYLSHASAPHAPTWRDTSARWLAAASSISVFLLLGLAHFPPARNTGRLLSISILLSVILATCLAFQQPDPVGDDGDSVSSAYPSSSPGPGSDPPIASPDLAEE